MQSTWSRRVPLLARLKSQNWELGDFLFYELINKFILDKD